MFSHIKKIKKIFLVLAAVILCFPAVAVKASEQAKPAVPVLQGTARGNTVTLTWNSVENASGYQIYLYYGNLGRYKGIKTISAKSERKLTLVGSADRVYKYKIRAYNRKNGKNTYSSLSKELQIKTAPSVPELVYLKRNPSKTAVALKWKKVSSADGYQVFRASSADGPYTRLAVVRGSGNLTYRDEDQKNGKGYYYKVRAYRKNPGTVVFSPYSKTEYSGGRSVIVVGDSRTDGLQYHTGSTEVRWIYKTAAGYKWLKETVVPDLESRLNGNEDVVIWLGVNDVYNVSNYINYINEVTRRWKQKGTNVYIMNVGPVNYDPYVSNAEIEDFNRKMKNGITGAKHLDLYGYLRKTGFRTTDGAHYDSATDKKIYSFMMKEIQ